jgi:hypothetical protein
MHAAVHGNEQVHLLAGAAIINEVLTLIFLLAYKINVHAKLFPCAASGSGGI